MIDRLRVGVYMARVAFDSHGTDRFWGAIEWWHTEVHYTIPRIKEEKRVAAELERSFTAESSRLFWVKTLASHNRVIPNIRVTPNISLLTFKDQRVVINPGKSSVGQWQWESVGIRTQSVPTPLRRLLIRVLGGGTEWVGDEGSKKPRTLVGPEYDRLPWRV